jgi:hypothetical protein
MRDKRLLDWMKPIALRQTFDRQDIRAVMTDRERKAGIDAAAVDEWCRHRTGRDHSPF